MKRINILYICLALVFLGLLQINRSHTNSAAIFFGFAENKETEINHSHPVHIDRIHVTTGQSVNKGDLLAQVSHRNIDFKLNDVTYDIDILEMQAREKRLEINNSIQTIEIEKATELASIDAKIEDLTNKASINENLLKDLKSIYSYN